MAGWLNEAVARGRTAARARAAKLARVRCCEAVCVSKEKKMAKLTVL